MWISAPWDARILRARIRAANGTLGATETIASGIDSFVVATNASGQAIIAWTAWDGTGSAVSARLRSASGVLSPVRRLSGYDVLNYAAAIGPAGDATATWSRRDSGTYRVAAVHLSADGAPGAATARRDRSRPPARGPPARASRQDPTGRSRSPGCSPRARTRATSSRGR